MSLIFNNLINIQLGGLYDPNALSSMSEKNPENPPPAPPDTELFNKYWLGLSISSSLSLLYIILIF
jgi:hypothetical protein